MTTEPAPPLLLSADAIARRDPVSGNVLLHPVTLAIHGGDSIVISGPSGSGKSVLLRALALLDPIQGGTLQCLGQPVSPATVPAWRARVAYIRQRPAMVSGSVEDNLRLPFTLKAHAGARFDRDAVLAWLTAAQRPATFLDKNARDLSGGEAQLVALVRALQLQPRILLLDEATAALDPHATAMVEALLRDWMARRPGQVASVWITHDPAQARRVGQRCFIMEAGRLRPGVFEAAEPSSAATGVAA